MRILLVGGSGYLGSLLNLNLRIRDLETSSLDAGFFRNCWTSKPLNLDEDFIQAQNLQESLIASYDAVVLLAAISNDPLKQISETSLYQPSEIYTKNIAMYCRNNNIRFIYLSSCSVYGRQSDIADENSPTFPQTPYSANKESIERILLHLETDTWKPLILRFATVYGPSPRIRFDTVVNMFCGLGIVERYIALNSDGEALRPFLFIDDGLAVIKWFLQLDEISYRNILNGSPIFNVGSDESNISIARLAELVSTLLGNIPIKRLSNLKNGNEVLKDRKIRDGVDSRSYKVSFAKLKNVLPKDLLFYTLDEGIRKTIEYLEALPLDSGTFYSKKYYRLQYLEQLIDESKLDYALNYIL
jgi:nucleoside-diphosphate-sugar epimerase